MSANDYIHDLAKEVSGFLGHGWFYEVQRLQDGEPLPVTAYLRHADGYGLYLKLIWNKPDRIEVSGIWPKDAKGQLMIPYIPYGASAKQHRPEITVALARGAEAVAEEIKKRFLPEYIPKWKEQAELARTNDEWASGQLALIERLAKAAGENLGSHERERRSFTMKVGGSWSDIEAHGPKDATLKLRVTAGQAERIVKMLKEWA